MTRDPGYELIDVGDGRRLERFGALLVDRPAPAASAPRRDPDAWRAPDLWFGRYAGWEGTAPADAWTVTIDGLTFDLQPTEAGQVGVFPEQRPTWAWLRDAVERRRVPGGEPPAILNLFGYTGGSTLAVASAGGAVAHVDASRPAVGWARRNAERSGLADRPIRWLVDDAEAFVARELRRGRRYAGVVLDPPSYGHGTGGKRWQLEDRLDALLDGAARLTGPDGFVVLSAHTPGFDPDRLADAVARAFHVPAAAIEADNLAIDAASGATLDLGAFARRDGQRHARRGAAR